MIDLNLLHAKIVTIRDMTKFLYTEFYQSGSLYGRFFSVDMARSSVSNNYISITAGEFRFV